RALAHIHLLEQRDLAIEQLAEAASDLLVLHIAPIAETDLHAARLDVLTVRIDALPIHGEVALVGFHFGLEARAAGGRVRHAALVGFFQPASQAIDDRL